MRRIPKPNGSFVVLRVWLGRVANPKRKVTFELSIVGDPSERGFGAVPLLPTDADLPTGLQERVGAREPERKIVARWQADAEDLGIPLDPATVDRFRDLLRPAVARIQESAQENRFWERLASRLWVGLTAAGDRLLDGIEATDLRLPRLRMSLPAEIGGRFAELCQELLPREDEPLWVEIMHPASYLPLVSWEQVIQEKVRRPVLRLAYHSVQPMPPKGPLTVVFCASATDKTQALPPSQLRATIRQIQSLLPGGSRIEVFVDSLHYSGLRKILKGDGDGVTLHDPPKLEAVRSEPAELSEAPASTGYDRQDHPWMSWMMEKLDGRAVDIVHWSSPGMLFPERGMLMVASHPSGHRQGRQRNSAIRWVSADDIRGFLLSGGAWAAIFSAPTQRLSRMGLRLLVDDLARLWTGSVALCEPKSGGDPALVADLYKLICSEEVRTLPPTHRARVYCHPAVTGSAAQYPDLHLNPEVGESWSRLQTAEFDLRQAGKLDVWIASTRRQLEQSISDHLVAEPSSTIQAAQQKGHEEAIAFIAKLLADTLTKSAVGGDDAD